MPEIVGTFLRTELRDERADRSVKTPQTPAYSEEASAVTKIGASKSTISPCTGAVQHDPAIKHARVGWNIRTHPAPMTPLRKIELK